jgi:hypothetical protein
MQTSLRKRDQADIRTIQNIKETYNKFIDEVQGDKKKQSKYYNVINEPILDIDPAEQVCPPYLHILLGIVKKHHDLLEKECHNLDCLIAAEKAKGTSDLSKGQYDQYIDQLKHVLKLEEKLRQCDEKLQHLNNDDNFALAEIVRNKTRISKLEKKMEDLKADIKKCSVNSKLKFGAGPVAGVLDVTLNSHKIKRQAYHSNSFIGNHCGKYLKVKVYSDLMDSVVAKTKELTTSRHLKFLLNRPKPLKHDI